MVDDLTGKTILRIGKQSVLLGNNTDKDYFSEVSLLNLGPGSILVEPVFINGQDKPPFLTDLKLLKEGEIFTVLSHELLDSWQTKTSAPIKETVLEVITILSDGMRYRNAWKFENVPKKIENNYMAFFSGLSWEQHMILNDPHYKKFDEGK
jgi:hypothetical protein